MALKQRFKRIWNIFNNRDPTGFTSKGAFQDYGPSYYQRPDRPQFTKGNARSIVTSIYNRIAMDAAQISIQHVQLDENGKQVAEPMVFTTDPMEFINWLKY